MGYRGTIRSINSVINQIEREQRRRQRELEKERKNLERMNELARASFEVQEYENRIEVLQTVHRDCSPEIDWAWMREQKPPVVPIKASKFEAEAERSLSEYTPSLSDKLLKKAETKRASLIQAVQIARQKDDEAYRQALAEYETEVEDWKALHALANGILSGDSEAKGLAFDYLAHSFNEVRELGAIVTAKEVEKDLFDIEVDVNSDSVVPKEKKTLLKSGKLSAKPLPVSQFNEIYQDYVSSIVLRVARESLALLPVEKVLVTAYCDLLNSATGLLERQPILSAVIPRATCQQLNFEMLDPSDAMRNFVFTMNFKKTGGFEKTEKIDVKSFVS